MTSMNGSLSPGNTSNKNKRKIVSIILLNGEKLIVSVDVKAKLYEVFNQVAAHLSLRETEYFGLAVNKDDEYHFLILDEKVSKIAPKKWKTGPGEGYDSDHKALLTLWFRVQFYVDQVVLLREKVTRHLYYLQLKENVLKYNHLYSEEKCFQIVGYALQADFGNYIPQKHTAGYFDPRQYFPAWMLVKHGPTYLAENSPLIHGDLQNMTGTQAQLKYVRDCSSPPAAHNLQFYRVRKKKTDKVYNTWLAVCARGVEVYEDDAGFKNLISTFLWPDIGKLYFDKRKFEIRSVGSAGGRKFTYYTDSDGTSKYLLHICRSTHMFQMAIHPKLMEIRHLDAEDKKRYRESYIYSDARDLVANGGLVHCCRGNKSPGKSPAGTQRYSVISDASSNTTSGIVSDKMAISFDEGEEHGKEIIIDCPPRHTHHVPSSQTGTKMSIGSYKMTPPATGHRSPALPPQSLELFATPGSSGKGSPSSPHSQELSPHPQDLSTVTGNGSYPTKFQTALASIGKSPSSTAQTFSLATPSPSSARERDFPLMIGISPSVKENAKTLQSAMMTTSGDRNGSGENGASVSSIPTALVPLSLENSSLIVGLGQYPSSPVAGSPKFNFGSPPPFQTQGVSSGLKVTDKTPSPNAGHLKLPMATLSVPDTSPPLYQLSTQSPVQHLYTDTKHHQAQELYSDAKHLQAQELYTDAKHHQAQEQQQADAKLLQAQEQLQADAKLLQAQELYAPPPPVFSDSAKVVEIPASIATFAMQSEQVQPCVHSGTVTGAYQYVHGGSTDSGHVLSDESSSAHHSAQSSEEDSGIKDSSSDSRKSTPRNKSLPSKPTHVSVKNQKEALHPELEQILGQTHALSLPMITALCNDLMTGSGHSSVGSYDMATLPSGDGRSRRISGEGDPRRWSACLPGGSDSDRLTFESNCSSTGTMLTLGSGGGSGLRPYSWHSEHFVLDTSLSLAPRGRIPPHHLLTQQFDNHRSEPHSLSVHPANTFWTPAITHTHASPAYGGSLDRYSPQHIAHQLMIPSRLSSGGHNSTDGSINHHKTLKENIGIA